MASFHVTIEGVNFSIVDGKKEFATASAKAIIQELVNTLARSNYSQVTANLFFDGMNTKIIPEAIEANVPA